MMKMLWILNIEMNKKFPPLIEVIMNKRYESKYLYLDKLKYFHSIDSTDANSIN